MKSLCLEINWHCLEIIIIIICLVHNEFHKILYTFSLENKLLMLFLSRLIIVIVTIPFLSSAFPMKMFKALIFVITY